MKILSIGNFGRGWDGSICDEEHIADSLERMDHEVIRLQREQKFDVAKHPHKYDFILIAQWNGYDFSFIHDLRSIGKIAYWAFDYQFDKNNLPAPEEWHLRLACESDVFLSKELEHAATYRHLGANFQWLSQDFAPMLLRPFEGEVHQDIDVMFTGSWLPWAPERTEYLRAVDKMFNLTICSFTPNDWVREGFKDVHGPVMDEALPRLIARAKVNLSIDWKYSEGYWSDRNSQIMACGGYVLFKYVPMSEAIFGPGIDYFYNIDDMLAKISRALKEDGYRETVAKIGYNQATWTGRLMVDGRVHDLIKILEAYV